MHVLSVAREHVRRKGKNLLQEQLAAKSLNGVNTGTFHDV